MGTDWRTLAATAHAPKDRKEFIQAAQELRDRGWRLDDIASALRLTRAGVIELLRGRA